MTKKTKPISNYFYFALATVLITWLVVVSPGPVYAVNVDELISKMSLEEKVGQVIMAGYDTYAYPDKSERQIPSLPELEKLVTDFKLGNIIIYCPPDSTPEPEEVADLTNHLQKMALETSGIPLFIAVDQEGGRVMRLRKGLTPFPGNMALGATRSAEYAYQAGRITAEELRALGININLAPVLDVNNNPDNPVINIRSFGENPQLVADLGEAFIRGSLDGKIIPVAKHFPGHGDTSIDSHYDLPTVRYGLERLNNIELLPFTRAIAARIPIIMPAHITFPNLDPTPGLPATLSEKIITGLLKKDMGFKGLVLCDDLEMSAITNSYGSCAQAALKSFLAGTDILMVAHTYPEQTAVHQQLLEAVKNKIIPLDRLNESVASIIKLKLSLYPVFSGQQVLVDPADIKNKINTEKNKRLALTIAQQAATLVQDDNRLIPLRLPPNRNVFFINPITGLYKDLLGQQLKSNYPNTHIINLSELTKDTFNTEELLQALLAGAREADLIIAGITDNHQIKIVKALSELNRPMIVISFSQPYFIKEFPLISTYLCVYSQQVYSLYSATDILLGRSKAPGTLPVSIPGIYDLEYKGLEQPLLPKTSKKRGIVPIAIIVLCVLLFVSVKIIQMIKKGPNLLDKILKERIKLDKLLEEFAHQCTFVSIDVVGSLKLKSGMDKVRISYTFNRYHYFVRTLTEKNNGYIFSTSGDGIMCLFKKPDEAVHTAQEIIRQLPEFNAKENLLKSDFNLRIGINTGQVLLNKGKPDKNIFDEVIDIAGHTQKNAQPAKVFITETTYTQLQDKNGFIRSAEPSELDTVTYYWEKPSTKTGQ